MVPQGCLNIGDIPLEQSGECSATRPESQIGNSGRSAGLLVHGLKCAVIAAMHGAGPGREDQMVDVRTKPFLQLCPKRRRVLSEDHRKALVASGAATRLKSKATGSKSPPPPWSLESPAAPKVVVRDGEVSQNEKKVR